MHNNHMSLEMMEVFEYVFGETLGKNQYGLQRRKLANFKNFVKMNQKETRKFYDECFMI